ncbi:hypothetical protein [Chryseobacterium sp. PET-29]|uniref:hypothetical protein n=1 Tax=Chryseobacterium sp. PET-29 TaxID=2983267 RepID=UPI0021E5ED47|nr:hypothetical protein [Chryseobacterium sp. PET-29]
MDSLTAALFSNGAFIFFNPHILSYRSRSSSGYHSEIIVYRVGNPYGTLLLAFAITVIEVSLIILIMVSAKGLETISLARDTVFAAVMIILTGIIGICNN